MSGFHAVADPVRLRIVRHLSRHGQATLAQLAEAAGVHENTARQHLQALEQAGVLLRAEGSPRGPGRPAVVYRLVPGLLLSPANPVGLAQLLAAVVVRSRPDSCALMAVGREWGRCMLGGPGTHQMEALQWALDQLGFDAEVADHEVLLLGCPCPVVAPDDPLLVCDLAVGVVDGLLTGTASELKVGARRHDPPRRRCQVQLETAGRAGNEPVAGRGGR